eukprot:3701620-Pleurochrysis_carterae.AAC.3
MRATGCKPRAARYPRRAAYSLPEGERQVESSTYLHAARRTSTALTGARVHAASRVRSRARLGAARRGNGVVSRASSCVACASSCVACACERGAGHRSPSVCMTPSGEMLTARSTSITSSSNDPLPSVRRSTS